MYTVLTSFPAKGCGNIGDKLIEDAFKKIFQEIRGETEFISIFREDDLTDQLPLINQSKALLMTAFPIRDVPMYPGVCKLTPDLTDIKVPMIPIGANWNVYPGDFYDRQKVQYSSETVDFLRYIANQTDTISVREYYAGYILQKHGISNTLMTGCPSWYDKQYRYQPMKRPDQIKQVVFTPPMGFYYTGQAIEIMKVLAGLYPDARRVCLFICGDAISHPMAEGETGDNSAAMKPEAAVKNETIRQAARSLGFVVESAAFNMAKLDFIENCDLHVGYDCHGSLSFLRRRIPSIMIAEDARGIGFAYTLGLPEFNAFKRCQYPAGPYQRPKNTSGYCDSLEAYEIAPADHTLPERISNFLEDQMSCRFSRFAGIADVIDTTWDEKMKPFIESIP